jgi:uncharacterized protein
MLIGREKEQAILQKALRSKEAEMVAVIGRRRVGKTYLIRSVYADSIRFETSGVQNASLKEQLNNFNFQLKNAFGTNVPTKPPTSWQDAFFTLIHCLEETPAIHQKVLFFDELPWLASKKSGFLNALSFFWNSWAVKKNIIVVICGSAASWMIQKVINDKGGLHNRITKRIDLQPFTLGETEAFLKDRGVFLERYQILQIYMAMGGIPHYLNEVTAGKSAIQNIQDICFSKNGMLQREFTRLYPALFDNAEQHIAIIRALAQKRSGMTRLDILEATALPDGGGTTLCLEELESSGFISAYFSFEKKKKDVIYRLTDEYSFFYLKFIEPQQQTTNDTWQHLSQTQSFKTWSGYAFESICLKHIAPIKKALGIAGIYTEASTFYQKGQNGQQGVQIDLLLDRNDNTINLFEIKFYAEPYAFTKARADAFRLKRTLFKHYSQSSKQVFLSFISTYGVVENEHSIGLVDTVIRLDALFEVV